MRTIFEGEVRKAFITEELDSNDEIKYIIDDKASETNVLFYKNVFGVVVRIDNGKVYFSRNGAYGLLYEAMKHQGEDCTVLKSFEYVNQATFTPKFITKQEFKVLKKAKTK